MKKILFLTLCLAILLSPVSVKAGDFNTLSDEAKEQYITSITETISKDLTLQTTPSLYFYSCAEWSVLATYYDGLNCIYVNIGALTSHKEAVKVMAHEIRHDYQYEHINDDTEYARAVKANKQNYIQYYNDLSGYYEQFIEKDAEEYAESYLAKHFK